MPFSPERNKNIARTIAVLFHVLMGLWFAFYGLTYQDPAPEEGIAINFGYDDFGSGNTTQAPTSTPTQPQPVSQPQSAAPDQVTTQDVEDAPAVSQPTETPKNTTQTETKPTETKPEPDPQPTPEELERQRLEQEQREKADRLNNLWNSSSKGSGQGEGADAQGGGDQGDPSGDILSPNRTGSGSSRGTGGGNYYGKIGNPVGPLPEPEQKCQAAGVAVIKIRVNSSGQVVEAEFASNSETQQFNISSNIGSNMCLVEEAIKAAKKSKWEPDSSQPIRVGFIVYRFSLE